MLKKGGCVRTQHLYLQVQAVSTTKHMNTSNENTVDFSGSSGKPTARLTKELMVVQQSPIFCCFLHLLLLPFPCSPPILPCLQWCPSFTSATSKACCEQPLWRYPLPTAAQTCCLRIKSYTHVINMTMIFLADWQHVFSSAEQYHQAAAKN